MAMTAAAYGQYRSADVVYTYFDNVPVHGMRVGDELFVPVESASQWGWQINVKGDSADVTAEGISFIIGVRNISGQTSLPLRVAMGKLGGSASWIPNTDTLQVVADLTSVKCQAGRVKVVSPLQIKPKGFALTNPDRLVLDYVGAHLGPKTVQASDGGVRITQYKPNVVRVVIQTEGAPDLSKISSDATRNSTVELAQANTEQPQPKPINEIPVEVKATELPPVAGQGTVVTPPGATTPVVTPPTPVQPEFLPVNLVKENEKSCLISIPLAGLKSHAQFRKPDPSTLEIIIPGVSLDLPIDFKLASDAVTLCRAEKVATGTKLSLYLNRPAGAEVFTDASGVSIQLLRPNVGDGKLSGKVIVVDAGHGGTDPGAHEAGYQEKNLTLPIAKGVAALLAQEGATVILTRKTDVFIPLTTRSDIANQNHADLFISCHINDSGGPRNMAGTITFHHKGNEISRVLAECIQNEIAKVSGIPNTGVWSDGKIYNSGFSVLRNTKMTGVLIEFGFIDNPQDRKRLITSQFQDAVSKAVVQGIKVYLGDAKTN